ncbi:hypothetical protein [Flavobacterium sp.]|uniref:hypothetical protein n=1 Tax=Flavobacterium sp. TaxID=239 RepID=UPI002B4B0FC7|nr:hypothetical protein [Flavobacterium sp.]HLP64200.1 hypothetical protein [Flavobacterium sp.]
MKLRFQTKEESNQQQQDEFLKLSKLERLYAFFRLMEQMSKFPIKNKEDKNKDNFIIVINTKK